MNSKNRFSDAQHFKAFRDLDNAVALERSGRLAEADDAYARLIKKTPGYFDALHLYGLFKFKTGKLADAVKLIERAHKLNPKSLNAANSLGVVHAHLKNFDKALIYFNGVLEGDKNNVQALTNKGQCLNELGRFQEAIEACDKAISVNNLALEAHVGRAAACFELHRYDDALSSYQKTTGINPNYPTGWCGAGNVFLREKRYDDALAAYARALSIRSDLAEAWLGRGHVFYDVHRYDEALASYDRALAFRKDLTEAWNGRGNVFFRLNRDLEAMQSYQQAISLKQNHAEAHFSLALLKLSLGEYQDGWRLYEWRWKSKTDGIPLPNRKFSQPLWLNDRNIAGKTLLVHAEQGLGDIIQFSRYVPLLPSANCKIIFEVQTPLLSLIQSQRWNCDVVAQGDRLPAFDYHCPLISLPLAFKTTIETVPNKTPYIEASEEKALAWSERLGRPTKPRIGLAWSGNAKFARGMDVLRPIPLSTLSSIMTERFEWHRLQTDLRETDRDALKTLANIRDFSSSLEDFSDTAALIQQMHHVITIDTSIAHLAGAMGKPVWILLPYHPDFRWLRQRTDSPWYPTARLYRQTKIGDWTDVLARVSADLEALFPIG